MNRRPWLPLGCGLLLLLLGPVLARAQDSLAILDFSQGVDTQGVPKGWQLKEKTGQADFKLENCDGVQALRLRSASTSFSFQKQVHVDLKQTPLLSWKWKVDRLPQGGDFRHARTDDQAAQLFVAFSKTRCIVYLWDTTAPQGLMADALAPPFMSIKVVVLRSGPGELGKWVSETRNVYDDYKKLYGESDAPPVASGVRLQINSQHTHSSAESAFADLKFTRS